MITGGVASVVYGDPRFTRDVDLVLELDEGDVESLESSFSREEFYVPPRSVMLEESARPGGGYFNIIHRGTALRADIYTAGDDPLQAWALRRRSRIDAGGTVILWLRSNTSSCESFNTSATPDRTGTFGMWR